MWFAAIFFIAIFVESSEGCDGRSDITVCELIVSSEPIAGYTLTQRLGYPLETCLKLINDFEWPAGVYCPSLQFCGLGIDLPLDYDSRWNRRAFLPSKHECYLITDIKVAPCDQLYHHVALARLFSQWRCDGGGSERCLSDFGTSCLPLQGNVKCHGCLPGFVPKSANDESECEDIDECKESVTNCGNHATCQNTRGSYQCDCDVGYYYNSENFCQVEYLGWDVQLDYYTHSGANFAELFSNLNNEAFPEVLKSEKFDKHFVNESIHENLQTATEIMVVIYDENGKSMEELTFNGSGHTSDWFSSKYLIHSSLWETSNISVASSFKMNPKSADFQFEITMDTERTCEQSGFFKMNCGTFTEYSFICQNFDWWAPGNPLDNKPCRILYSKQSTSVDYSEGHWASRVQIVSKPGWQKVFMVESFAGIDPYQFYKSGTESNTFGGEFYEDMVFRDTDIENKIKNAESIRLLVFDKEKTHVASELIFNGNGDFETWFRREHVKQSSLWDFEIMDVPHEKGGEYFTILTPSPAEYRFFYINNNWGGCKKDGGWFLVTTSRNSPCDWEKWWNLKDFEDKGENQPPFILYGTTEGPQKSSEWQYGSKFELFVSWKL